jgi:hypothetical protein
MIEVGQSMSLLLALLALSSAGAGCGDDREIEPGGMRIGTVEGTVAIPVPREERDLKDERQSGK